MRTPVCFRAVLVAICTFTTCGAVPAAWGQDPGAPTRAGDRLEKTKKQLEVEERTQEVYDINEGTYQTTYFQHANKCKSLQKPQKQACLKDAREQAALAARVKR